MLPDTSFYTRFLQIIALLTTSEVASNMALSLIPGPSLSMSSPTIPPETNGGVVTTWVPLTTTFVWPSDCTNSYIHVGATLQGFIPIYGPVDLICQPPAVVAWQDQGDFGGDNSVYNTVTSIQPFVCPMSFLTVAVTTKDESSRITTCCLPGHVLQEHLADTEKSCLSSVASGMVLTYATTLPGSFDSVNKRYITTTLTSSSTVAAMSVVGWNVDRAMATGSASSGRKSFSSTPSFTSLSSTISTISPSFSSEPLSVLSAASTTYLSTSAGGFSGRTSSAFVGQIQQVSDGFSAGAKVGIGIGISLSIIGVACLVLGLYLIRRRKQEVPVPAYGPEPKPGGYIDRDIQELDAAQRQTVPELEGEERWELDDTRVHIRGPTLNA